MKVRFFVLLAIFVFSLNLFSQGNSVGGKNFSAQGASRRTALRYLKLAKSSALSADWEKCAAFAKSGNEYDDSVADLWYLMALGKYNCGTSRKDVLPLLEKSLSGAEWVDYNKSGARIFLADLLCAMGKPSAALEILDEAPFIYSADAECVRVKSYYTIGDAENVARAREKVNVSRRIYPNDPRFAHLFFAYEYKIMYAKNPAAAVFDYMPLSGEARKIADYFIAKVPEYDSNDVELEIYAAIFAEGEQKTRLLQAFDARGFKSPLFAAAAVEDGIISEDAALEYFLDFMEKSGAEQDSFQNVSVFELERFASVLKNPETKKNLAAFLNAYTGTLFCDTNNSLEANLAVSYSRGRPQKIEFDADNDGGADWICECDFGVPRTARFLDKKICVQYGTYPSPVRVVFEEVPGEQGATIFNLADETVDAQIFRIRADEFISRANVSDEFFIVDEKTLWSGDRIFDVDALIASVNSVERPSKERDGATIRFSMLNGVYYAADYLLGGKLYAHAQFASPLVRNVDRDGDGIFETTEIYATLEKEMVISKEDLDAATQNIWGSPVPNPSVFLRMIQIDRNVDTRADFSEEYFSNGGRISTWDLDYDGEWDSRHTIFPKGEGDFDERSEIFVMNSSGERKLVSLNFFGGEPREILFDGNLVPVTKGAENCFYWIGETGAKSQERNVKGRMKFAQMGVVEQFEDDGCYIQAILIDKNIFARIIRLDSEN
ncbi:MAG: hypothetical protein HDR33_10135 [Treponema sp.]|nr:hypothetical protein [Treponema sp.]